MKHFLALLLAVPSVMFAPGAAGPNLTYEGESRHRAPKAWPEIDTPETRGDSVSVSVLGEALWTSIPGSAMNSVFVPGADDVSRRAANSWRMIQDAWSGGVCAGNEL